MFKDFMNNDCGNGNQINKFTNQFFDNKIGGQQQESWHEDFNNMQKPMDELGEIYQNNNNPNMLMRFDPQQRERMFEMGRLHNMHPNEKMNQFYFSEDEMLKEYKQFRPQMHMRSNNQMKNRMIGPQEWNEEFQQYNNVNEDWRTEYDKSESQDWHEEFHQQEDWSYQYQSKLNDLEEDYERAYSQQDQKGEWVDEYDEFNMEKTFEENLLEKQEQEDDDWFSDYLQNEKQFSEQSMKNITQQLLDINDPKLQNSNFMKFISKVHTGEFSFEGNNLVTKQPPVQKKVSWEDDYKQFESPNEMVNEYNQFQRDPNLEIREMVNDYQNFTPQQNQQNDMVREYFNGEQDDMVNEYQGYVNSGEDYDAYDDIWNEDGNWNVDKVKTKEYQFSSDNPYLSLEHPYEKGIELMDNGRIKDAILAFEAEVTKNPENVKAWHMLGKAHAEGDKDEQAIEALKRAIKLEPDNLESYIDIAVSFTNTMHKDKALQSLEQWLSRNPKYKEIANKFGFKVSDSWLDTYSGMSLKSMYERHDYVANAFLESARLQPNDIDADIQIILGLMYNISMDYDKAVECFRAALYKRPEDYTLWNKLGATLANNNRSEEAVDAYLNALEHKPLYVRAIANLGISFVALNKYEDAAKQFLSALSLEPSAKHIWSNLENSFSFMDRHDLIDKIGDMNPEIFRKYIDF